MLAHRIELTTARHSRRQFLIGVASTAGLVVGYRLIAADPASAQARLHRHRPILSRPMSKSRRKTGS